MRVIPDVKVHELLPNDVIHFGDGMCFVVAVESESDTTTLITEGIGGMQYVDYVDSIRRFMVVRTN